MKFQPGQSGNPAGRPLGARNKKTIAMEEELAKRAEKAVGRIIYHAEGGNPVAMRICAEWVKPGGNSRALALELPRITCADDAQAALDMVIAEFGNGAITVRELPIMLGSVDRMARVAERIQQNREAEKERYKAQRVHGIHPDMIPKAPPGWVDPLEALNAAIERGEDPFPDDPVKSAYVLAGEDLYSPVNSEDGASSLTRAAGEGGSPERSDGETGGGAADAPEGGALYSPVNSDQAVPSQSVCLDSDAISAREVEPANEPLAPSLPREQSERGEGGERSEPGGGSIFCSERASPPTPDPSPPRFAWGEGNPAARAVADEPQEDSLHSSVNSGPAVAWENRPELPDGSRLVAALTTPDGGGEPLYPNPQSGPDPLIEAMRRLKNMASDALASGEGATDQVAILSDQERAAVSDP